MSGESIHQKRPGRQVEGAGWAGVTGVGREQRPPVSATGLSGNHSLIGRDQTMNQGAFHFLCALTTKGKETKSQLSLKRDSERHKEAGTPSKSQTRRDVGQRVMDKQELKECSKDPGG